MLENLDSLFDQADINHRQTIDRMAALKLPCPLPDVDSTGITPQFVDRWTRTHRLYRVPKGICQGFALTIDLIIHKSEIWYQVQVLPWLNSPTIEQIEWVCLNAFPIGLRIFFEVSPDKAEKNSTNPRSTAVFLRGCLESDHLPIEAL